MDREALYTALTIGASLAVLLGDGLRRRVRRKGVYATPSQVNSLKAQFSTISARPLKAEPEKRRPPGNLKPSVAVQTVSRLEAELRLAIFSPDARERLVQHALQITKGDRAAALRKVLDDLHAENNRWS